MGIQLHLLFFPSSPDHLIFESVSTFHGPMGVTCLVCILSLGSVPSSLDVFAIFPFFVFALIDSRHGLNNYFVENGKYMKTT